MYCRNCGTELTEGTKFCPNCGTKQEGDASQQTAISPEHSNSFESSYTDSTAADPFIHELSTGESISQTSSSQDHASQESVSQSNASADGSNSRRAKRSFGSKLAFVLMIISGFFTYLGYSNGGLDLQVQLAGAQTILFFLVWLLGKRKKAFFRRLLMIIALLLSTPYVILIGSLVSESSAISNLTSTIRSSESSIDRSENSTSSPSESSPERAVEPQTESYSTSESQEASSGLDPDFKEFMDSYEKVVNSYCDFMEKYSEASEMQQLTMAVDYTKLLGEYTDMAAKVNNYDIDSLSDADLAYYVEVTARIEARLLKAALN